MGGRERRGWRGGGRGGDGSEGGRGGDGKEGGKGEQRKTRKRERGKDRQTYSALSGATLEVAAVPTRACSIVWVQQRERVLLR